MSRVFLLGPLSWTPLLEAVLGYQPNVKRVDLTNVSLGVSDVFAFPQIDVDAHSHGLSVDLDDPEAFNALSFFASVFDAHPVPKHGAVEGKRCSGVLFVADAPNRTATALIFEDWLEKWGATALIAAREIMGYRGRVPARDLKWRLPMILSRAAAEDRATSDTAPTQHRVDKTRDAITVHDAHSSHEGFFLTRTYELQHARFDGRQSERLSREVFVAADAVIVLPYDPVRDRVLLVEQFRMGPFARGDVFPWVLEPPAGRVDAGETVEHAARRECEEEAGLVLSRLEHVTSHYCSPGASTEFYHCFVALADLPDTSMGLGGLATEHEDIRTHVIAFDDALDLLSSGEANIGPLILLLLWLQRERPRLRSLA